MRAFSGLFLGAFVGALASFLFRPTLGPISPTFTEWVQIATEVPAYRSTALICVIVGGGIGALLGSVADAASRAPRAQGPPMWRCHNGHMVDARSRHCPYCAPAPPVSAEWRCACGAANAAGHAFCGTCGRPGSPG